MKFWNPLKRAKKGQLVAIRDDANEFVLNGDKCWGDSITWSKHPSGYPEAENGDTTRGRIVGWVTPKPVPGDVVLIQMSRGWARWVVQSVEHASGVADMFYADIRGVVDYLHELDREPPRAHRATELIAGMAGDFIP